MREITGMWKWILIEKIKDRGPAVGYKFINDTRNTKHIYVQLRTFSPKEQEEHVKQVEEMLQKHIIARTRGLLSAPVLLLRRRITITESSWTTRSWMRKLKMIISH